MNAKSIFATLTLSILFSAPVFAENGNHCKTESNCKNSQKQLTEQTTLDKIQQETEQISILKPVLSLAKLVEVKIQQNKEMKAQIEKAIHSNN